MNKIALSFSPHWLNKENRAPLKPNKEGKPSNRYAYAAFTSVQVPPDAIIKHLTAGRAISVAAITDNWRHERNFVSSQIMGIDFDQSPGVGALLQDDFVREYAFLVYPTPSHTDDKPRSRVLFLLDMPITDAEWYKQLIKRLMHRFSIPLDESCKDVVRIFYGSTQPGWKADASKCLPIAVLEALPAHPDELKPPPAERQATAITDFETRTRAESYALKTKQNILGEALAITSGAGLRHAAFNAAVCKALAKRDWIGFESIESELRWLGVQMGRDEDEIERSIRGALSEITPEPLTLPERATKPVLGALHEDKPVLQAPSDLVWKTSNDGLERYRERLRTARGNGKLPLIFPFHSLHQFSGLAHVLERGFVVGIVGMSGGTKTSFVECLTEPLRQMGAHGLWWGIEWSWEKMADRAIQRHGGATTTEMNLHTMWLEEIALGIAPGSRNGVPLPEHRVRDSEKIAQQIEAWGGKNHQLEKPVTDVDMLLALSTERVKELTGQGIDVAYVVFDYMQLLDLYSAKSEAERITTIQGKLKAFCIENQLIGFVVSQVTKANSANARSGSAVLEAEAGQFMRSDKFNLVLTLNPIYAGGLLTNQGVLNVAKNSEGRTGKVWLYINPARFQWTDTIVSDSERIKDTSEVVF